MGRVPGRAGPAAAASPAVILSSAACWAGLGSMRHTVSDPGVWLLSAVYSCGEVVPRRPHAGRTGSSGGLYRPVAAVVGVAAGGGVRAGRDQPGRAAGAGAGQEPAAGGRQAGWLRGRAGGGRRRGGAGGGGGGRDPAAGGGQAG